MKMEIRAKIIQDLIADNGVWDFLENTIDALDSIKDKEIEYKQSQFAILEVRKLLVDYMQKVMDKKPEGMLIIKAKSIRKVK